MASRGIAVSLAVVAAAAGAAVWFATRTDEGGSGAARGGDVPAQTTADVPAATKSGKRERASRHGAGIVVGSVRVFGSDKPVVGTAVTLTAGDQVLETTTQADGTFALASVPKAAEWTLRVGGAQGLGDAELAGVAVVDRRVTDVGVVYLAPGFAVPGVVEDEHGAPVAGASVVALKPRESGRGLDMISMVRELGSEIPSAKTTESDKDGKFRLTGLPPGTYTVVARKSGFATGVQRNVLFAPGGETQTVRLVLGKGHRLEGRVTRKGEGPVAGLRVVAFTTDGMEETFDLQMPDKAIARTDEKGAFVFDSLRAGTWNVGVAPDGEALAFHEDVRVPQQSFVELSLEGGATLSGRVTDTAGAPIAGAEVVAGSQKSVGTVETGADGRYAIRGLAPGPAEFFMVRADGYCPHPPDGLAALMDPSRRLVLVEGTNTRDVQLVAGGRVKGTVVEEGTTTPLAGVTVSIMSSSLFMSGPPVATTDSEGRFEIAGVPPGEALVTAKKTGWCQPGMADAAKKRLMESSMNLLRGGTANDSAERDPGSGFTVVIGKPGDVVERTLGLVRCVVMTGRVLAPDGTPLAGAQVAARPEQSRDEFLPFELTELMTGGAERRLTGADGRFEVSSPVVSGAVRLVAKARGFLDARSEPVELAVGAAPPETELRMAAGGRVEGRVVSAAGAAIADAAVHCDVEQGDGEYQYGRGVDGRVFTSADGAYHFDAVRPGKVTVRVQHPQFIAATRQHVEVTESQTAKADFLLEPGKSIKGRIVRSDGERFAGHAWLDVEPEGGVPDGFESPDEEVAEDGTFRIDGLRDGRYRITAQVMTPKADQGLLFSGRMKSEPVIAEAGATGVELRVDSGAAIAGIVRLAGGGPVAGVTVHAKRTKASEQDPDDDGTGMGRTGQDGRFRVDGLSPGRYDLTVVGVGMTMVLGEKSPNVRMKRVRDVSTGTDDLSIEVEPGLTISGTVRLPDGKPALAGEVTARSDAPRETEDEADEGTEHHIFSMPTGIEFTDGRFEVAGLDPGTYSMIVEVEGYPAVTVKAEAGTKDVVAQLVRGGTVKGRVLMPDGKPAKGASVSIQDDEDEASWGADCETDDQGNFELKGVLPGEHRVAADWFDEVQDEDDDMWFEGAAERVNVKADQTVEGVEIRLKKGE